MKHPTSLYFAYGANINADDMSWRCPRARPVGVFELHNWQLELYCHATIEPKQGSSVHGILWELTPECEQALDRFEGFPSYYTKRTWNQGGQWFFFYEMTDPKSGKPSQGYIRGIANGYDQWQLPQSKLKEALDRTYDLQRGNTEYISG
jgi:gamma-glutamylcyclotransferase (GGCT)/AIG2-like uncharacterized protein YtfP